MHNTIGKFYVGKWQIQPPLNRLCIEDKSFHVEPKVMRVLVYLAERAGEVVARKELMEVIWSDTVIHEDVLSRCVSELRKIFKDSPRESRYIETIHKTGYRLVAPVSLPETGKSHKPIRYSVIFVTVIILLLAGFFWLTPLKKDYGENMPLDERPITSYVGREIDPAFSPDGHQVAFAWDKGIGKFNLYIKAIENEHFIQLTDNPAMDISPAWSPDGQHIVFVRISGDVCTIHMISSTGGTDRKLCDCNEWEMVKPQWMVDGRHLVFSDRVSVKEPYRIISFSLDSLKKKYLVPPAENGLGDIFPAVSFGNRLAFVRLNENSEFSIMTWIDNKLNPWGDETFRKVLDLEWMPDGRSLVFTGYHNDRFGLWKISGRGGKITWLPTGIENIIDLTVYHPGSAFSYEKRSSDDNIWRISLSDPDSDPVQVIASTRWDSKPRYSPDEEKIAYQSTRSGHHEIWMVGPDNNQIQLTSLKNSGTRDPVWSPDGKYIGFSTSIGDSMDLYSVRVDNRILQQLTTDLSDERDMQWSGDGKEIYYRSNRGNGWDVWNQQAGRSDATRITRSGDISFFKVCDGAVYYTRTNKSGLWKIHDGTSRKVLKEPGSMASRNWTVTNEGVYFVRQDTTESILSYYEFTTGFIKDITILEKLSIFSGLGLAPDKINCSIPGLILTKVTLCW